MINPKSLDNLESQLKLFFSDVVMNRHLLEDIQKQRIIMTKRDMENCEHITRRSLERLLSDLRTFSDYHGVDIQSKPLSKLFDGIKYQRPIKMSGVQRRAKKNLATLNDIIDVATKHCALLDEILEGE